ncbi:ABC transporter substrate-binding protein [Paenibacillus sp. HB172176]|uniref:ABC transporter substrate-binding protein n=1 Tax=Paenibacillus sp. HB172176 TaxID=2493690 RepID=UPI001438DC6C|nr:ABC transporter substrate-binding protein [Paenibacillus sp. HB172176]
MRYRNRLHQSFVMIALLVICLAASACSSNSNGNTNTENTTSPTAAEGTTAAPESTESATGGKTVYPLVISNYTLNSDAEEPKAKNQTFEKAPERVVANTQPVAELLIKLGLTDKLVGVAALNGAGDPEVSPEEFAKIPVLSEGYVSKEPVVGADPDLVIGRGGLFGDADWGVGSVDALNDLGIATFVNSTSLQGATLDSLYKDIEEIGQIFDVQDNAAALIDKLKTRTAELKDTYSDGEALKFAIINDNGNGGISVDSGSHDSFQHDVLGLINLNNAFSDVEGYEVSIEQLVADKPDVLLLSYYTGAPDTAKTIENVYANPALQDVPAVKNKKIFVIDFNAFWGFGDQIVGAVEKLAKELYGK